MVFQVSLSCTSIEKWQDDWYIPPRILLRPLFSIPQKFIEYLLGARDTVVCQGYICGASENHKALTGKTTLEYLAAENSASCINIQVSWQALSYAIYEKKPERCLFPRNLASLLELLRMLQFPPPLQEAIYVPWRTRLEGHLAGCCQQR